MLYNPCQVLGNQNFDACPTPKKKNKKNLISVETESRPEKEN